MSDRAGVVRKTLRGFAAAEIRLLVGGSRACHGARAGRGPAVRAGPPEAACRPARTVLNPSALRRGAGSGGPRGRAAIRRAMDGGWWRVCGRAGCRRGNRPRWSWAGWRRGSRRIDRTDAGAEARGPGMPAPRERARVAVRQGALDGGLPGGGLPGLRVGAADVVSDGAGGPLRGSG